MSTSQTPRLNDPYWMLFWDLISILGTLPGSLLLALLAFGFGAKAGWIALLGVMIVTLLCNLYKMFTFKARPDNPEGTRPPLSFPLRRWTNLLIPKKAIEFFHYVDASSFPSIHSARAFFLAFYFSGLGQSIILAFFYLILATLVGKSRIVKRRHFASDVFAGSLLGLLISMLTSSL